ncbi:hypothetical protein ACFWJ4_08170 [Kitasatospora sp. NPDC127067]|uniref:hypothetical protein n=1 Tax=Kitasatospora sp. NPDC127067 TaxID=3347126 RepID=UPI00365C2930
MNVRTVTVRITMNGNLNIDVHTGAHIALRGCGSTPARAPATASGTPARAAGGLPPWALDR